MPYTPVLAYEVYPVIDAAGTLGDPVLARSWPECEIDVVYDKVCSAIASEAFYERHAKPTRVQIHNATVAEPGERSLVLEVTAGDLKAFEPNLFQHIERAIKDYESQN